MIYFKRKCIKMTKEYKVGDIIKCVVTGIQKYGIFVSVNDTYSGLIHISEVSSSYVKNIYDYVKLNEKIYCQILAISEDNHHLKLSIKDINYKENNDTKIKETRKGFLPLKENLPIWLDEKLKVYKN